MQRIAILISGKGSNMRVLAQACTAEKWPAQVVAVISNVPSAPGLETARALGLHTAVLDHRAFAQREDFDLALQRLIDLHEPTLICMAGFMRVMGEHFVQHYQGRLLNIHPSLLPAFPGLHTHRRALEAGVKLAGCTVHLVTAELDHGPIVLQAAVPVHADDDEHKLAQRVLQAEHRIYPRAVGWWVRGELSLSAGVVRHVHQQPQFDWVV